MTESSVQPKRNYSRILIRVASISLLCAGVTNRALASTAQFSALPHENIPIKVNLEIRVAANATPTPSTGSNTGVLAFADYIQNRQTMGWSSAVYRKYEKEQVVGKLILDLSGTIIESGKDSHGF